MDVEVLAHVTQHLHRLTRREKTSSVRVDGVTNHLMEHRAVTHIVVDHLHNVVIDHVGRSQMHILTHGQVQCITGLVGIHDMLVFL